jgi:ferric-dicitrate binding protein FerR (iron transport regulator)
LSAKPLQIIYFASLNKNSTLFYSNFYGSDAREVNLQGEAFFEVVKNADKEFVVATNNSHITVLGTVFNVKSYPEDSAITTTLIEGSVRFETLKQTVVLKPSQQLTYNTTANKINVNMIEISVATSWKDNLIRYRSIPFSQFLDMLEKQYQVEILLADKKLERQIVGGTFDAHLSVEQILDLTKQNLLFQWKKKGDKYLIIR